MGEAFLRFACRDDGDFAIDGEPVPLDERRRGLAAGTWTWLRQTHGAEVVTVIEPGQHAGAEADGAVSDHPEAVLAVHAADCVPVLFATADGGVVGAAHAGWRGLVAGVLEATVDAMVDLGADEVTATVGPHIRARCYEFGESELDVVADRLGGCVRATTSTGTPGLDLTAGVRAALGAHSAVAAIAETPGCTACEPERFFSHRARGDLGRHAAVVRAGGSK